ncbi:adenosylmethionine decarboxylase [Bacillus sp. 1NLA3E]|uniref:adenosylmethionine decarboxylase n=1 Tax=Bacillus sp. 1NLA3E TaxID=666686 RepID=UPI000247F2BA|nr:adenosylmethionine decarboxylase [Bacillus sp. 1NLA3E]AGK53903.1 spermidine synthase [Bacillus sp. 1NLA3E]
MDIQGQHLVVDAYDCIPETINDADGLKRLMLKALNELKMEVLLAYFHSFSPQGVTGIIAISTSHFSIHTWPEYGYVALDLYTCSTNDAWPALKRVLGKMGARRVCMYEITRGIEGQVLSKCENFRANVGKQGLTVSGSRGNEWDMKVLKEIKRGGHKILFEGSSPFQDILLAEAKDLRLYLNEELQFSSLDEKHYHEALVLPAMELAKSRDRVLILGGGDGLGLREVLKYPDVKHTDLVDIDPFVIELAKNDCALVGANTNSLKDGRVKVHITDAIDYLKGVMEAYGVIIIDFPDPVDPTTSSLYTKELFHEAGRHLAEGGVIVCQANSPQDTPRVFWSISMTLNAAGFQTKAYFTVVPSFGVWGFHLASRGKIKEKMPEISVPHQAIESNLDPLFYLPPVLQKPIKGLIINRKNDPRLHELYLEEIEKI